MQHHCNRSASHGQKASSAPLSAVALLCASGFQCVETHNGWVRKVIDGPNPSLLHLNCGRFHVLFPFFNVIITIQQEVSDSSIVACWPGCVNPAGGHLCTHPIQCTAAVTDFLSILSNLWTLHFDCKCK